MRSPGVILAAVILLLCFVTVQLPAQDNEQEADWLVLERGKVAFQQGEFGDALVIFRSVLGKNQIQPEAHYWIGRIFEEEGELDLAEKEFNLALDFRKQLYVLEDEIRIRERLARLYKLRQDYPRFETELMTILRMDKEYGTPESDTMQTAMTRVLERQGLNQVFTLYRLDKSPYFLSHAELGLFYYRTGRYSDSVMNLLASALTVLTRTLEFLQANAPFEEFTTPEEILGGALALDASAEYMEQTHAAALFYYLGAALYAQGDITAFREVMHLVRDVFTRTQWRTRAISQLADPYIEPVITSKEFFYFF